MGIKKFEYILTSFDTHFPPFAEEFRTFCESQNVEDSKIFDMEVSLEELITNSFSYGKSSGKVLITASIEDGELVITMEDEAPPFNLLREAPDPPKGSIAERQVGGLGIHLVKNLSDRITYSGSGKGNHITLFKSIK